MRGGCGFDFKNACGCGAGVGVLVVGVGQVQITMLVEMGKISAPWDPGANQSSCVQALQGWRWKVVKEIIPDIIFTCPWREEGVHSHNLLYWSLTSEFKGM